MKFWEEMFSNKVENLENQDSAHDVLHCSRVVITAKKLCAEHSADLNVVIPAAWLHDFVIVNKDDPLRSQASRLSADAAIEYLDSVDYPEQYFENIAHAIESHSYSANITPKTIEAKIVQDADRLDALGAIGIARCLITGSSLKRPIYRVNDPFCKARDPEDHRYTLDHFYTKLFRIADSMQTDSGRAEAQRRVAAMQVYLQQLESEIAPQQDCDCFAQ